MEKVRKAWEIKVTTENKTGITADLTALIAGQGVNIENICLYTVGDKAYFHILSNINGQLRKIIEGKGFTVEEREVIILELWNRPGMLSKAALRFKQEGIGLQSLYGTTSPGGERTTIVFKADDNEKAAETFDALVLEDLD
jgi:hypothetical protein